MLHTPLGKWTKIDDCCTVMGDDENVFKKMPHALVDSPKGVPILDLHTIKEVWRSAIPQKM
eukprot:13037101-Ditylum_brightwellii.AAC.1